MSEPILSAKIFEFIGGWLCLDFTNTIGYVPDPDSTNGLRSFADLIDWGEQAGILTPTAAQMGRESGSDAPLLNRALALRTTLYRLFSAAADGHTPASSDLDALNATLREALAQRTLRWTPAGFVWAWNDANTPQSILWQVAWSASELLVSDQLERVRQCAGDDCTFLFIDTSRNHSRRWCDMKSCGNQAKAHRHYHRQRASTS